MNINGFIKALTITAALLKHMLRSLALGNAFLL